MARGDKMNKEKEIIQIFDFKDFIENSWKIICGCILVMLLIAGGYIFSKPSTYVTEIKVRLPQYYSSNKMIYTGIDIATGDIIKNIEEKMNLDTSDTKVKVRASWVKDTSIIKIEFSSSTPDKLKSYADYYQEEFLKNLNVVVNEQLHHDLQMFIARSSKPFLYDPKDNTSLERADIIKSAETPEKPISKNYMRYLMIAGFSGLLLGGFISVIKYKVS